MSPGLADWLLRAVLVSALAATAACGHAGPQGDQHQAKPGVAGASCGRRPGPEKLTGGPLAWATHTLTFGRTWLVSHGATDRNLQGLYPKAPIVIDSVSLAPQPDPEFAPVVFEGAWFSQGAGSEDIRPAGTWPVALTPVTCYQLAVHPAAGQPNLVVRLKPVVGAAAHGRKWASYRAIVIHYHTLDGTPYAAPLGEVEVFPTSKVQRAGDGMKALNRWWAAHPDAMGVDETGGL